MMRQHFIEYLEGQAARCRRLLADPLLDPESRRVVEALLDETEVRLRAVRQEESG